MSVEVTGKYLGAKKVELVHGPSGEVLITEAPKDNGGEGKSFSPTDLVAAA
jgi:putative redox protein